MLFIRGTRFSWRKQSRELAGKFLGANINLAVLRKMNIACYWWLYLEYDRLLNSLVHYFRVWFWGIMSSFCWFIMVLNDIFFSSTILILQSKYFTLVDGRKIRILEIYDFSKNIISNSKVGNNFIHEIRAKINFI